MHAGGAARGPTGKLGELVRAKDFPDDSLEKSLARHPIVHDLAEKRSSFSSYSIFAMPNRQPAAPTRRAVAAARTRVGLQGLRRLLPTMGHA